MQHDGVVQIAVHHQKPAAIGEHVDGFVTDLDSPERQAEELPRDFIVIAGDVNDLRAFTCLAQYFLYQIVMRLRPEPATPELPAVDDVADQIKMFRFVVAQEIKKVLGLASRGSEVYVGNPDGPVSVYRCWRVAKIQMTVLMDKLIL